MATFFLVSTQRISGISGILTWRPALSNGTPTGGNGGSIPVVHNQDILTPLRRYIIQIGVNCEIYPAKSGTGADGGSIWIKDGNNPICNGGEVLVQFD